MHPLLNGNVRRKKKFKNLETNTIIKFIENNHLIKQLETAELKSVIDEFPYFQSARALYLKGLKKIQISKV